jgi:peptidyl-prolyl cis-trans isomerase SurA
VSLAKQYSKDPQTGPKGGDLGVSASNKYVPSFAAAIEALKVHEVSDPVKTRFGYHLIFLAQRLTRSLASVRSSIVNILKAPAADKAWSAWLEAAYADADVRVNPRYGELDVASRTIVDTPAEDVPGADVQPTPSGPAPGQPQTSP